MSATPETDNNLRRYMVSIDGDEEEFVLASFARKLEEERDGAKAAMKIYKEKYDQLLKTIEVE